MQVWQAVIAIRSGVYAARRKFPKARLPGREGNFIPLKFSGRELSSEQENLQPVKSDYSLFTEASALPMR